MPLSPIRSSNPLGRPFGGGRGRGTGRWIRGGAAKKHFNTRRDRSLSRSPRSRHRSRSRERTSSHRDRDRKRNSPPRSSNRDKNSKERSHSRDVAPRKDPAPVKNSSEVIPQMKEDLLPKKSLNDDPPPPGTEDDVY